MKILKVVLIIVIILLVALVIMMWFGSRPMSKQAANQSIQNLLEKEVAKKKTVSSGLIYISMPSLNYEETFSAGEENGQGVDGDQPFHVASVGKAFTATLIATLIEDGKLELTDKVSGLLEASILDGLFVYEGKDYSDEVTVKQLLNHTSGIADYFEDDAEGMMKMTELVIEDPDRFFTPMDLVNYSRDYQKAVAKPGETYHYSDTGFILLGLIIESVTKQSFDDVLHERIFTPLEMNDTYLMFYSEPVNGYREIADVWLLGQEISGNKSLSVDWAGGGVISTLADLAIFARALNNGEIVSDATLQEFYQFDYKFMTGLHYGNGFMEYHFGDYFPTLKSLPKYRGHMGILGTHMLYDIETDSVYISSFGSTDYSAGSVQTMIKILSTIERIED